MPQNGAKRRKKHHYFCGILRSHSALDGCPSGRTSHHRTAVEINKYIKQAVLSGTRAYHAVRGD
jgi:hypothetical protein